VGFMVYRSPGGQPPGLRRRRASSRGPFRLPPLAACSQHRARGDHEDRIGHPVSGPIVLSEAESGERARGLG